MTNSIFYNNKFSSLCMFRVEDSVNFLEEPPEIHLKES